MDSSMGIGFMTVFAVSGSVVLLARQVHKRLLSDFMEKIECELCGSEKCEAMKKKVRFAADVMEPSSNSKDYRNKKRVMMMTKPASREVDHDHHQQNQYCSLKMEEEDSMPLNRQILYKGIIQYKSLKSIQ